jgi:hypothetical protein
MPGFRGRYNRRSSAFGAKQMVKRKKDKQIIAVVTSGVAATPATLKTVIIYPADTDTGTTFPCTFTGIRASGTVWNSDLAATHGSHFWAVQLIRSGDTPQDASLADAATILKPEVDIIIWGRGATINDSTNKLYWPKHYDMAGTTKRKMQIGDCIYFVCASGYQAASDAGATNTFAFLFQYFLLV